MDGLLESAGAWLARAHAVYGFVFLLLPLVAFAYLPVLAAAVWAVTCHARGRRPWPRVPTRVRRWTRLALEVAFGLVNPVIYLATLAPSMPALRPGWGSRLTVAAWVLLGAFWSVRVAGAALDPCSRAVRYGVRLLLWAALACVLLYTVKDASLLLFQVDWHRTSPWTIALNVLRVCPLYLVPVVLLWDYAQAVSKPAVPGTDTWHGLFVLPDRAARTLVTAVAAFALVTVALAAQRRSEGAVRRLVADHREPIQEAAARYDVDPRLLASIVYVTHRDQLSPFRDELERVVIGAWAGNVRGEFGLRPPENVSEIGTDENPLLNRALDISIGLAQIKPRTAQTASVLASGRTPDELPGPEAFTYREAEPVGGAWKLPPAERRVLASPVPVPAARHVVADALLDARSNLAMSALILALYRHQWEAANPAWSLRERPDVLATLYQIGFARSRPHGDPRSNAFGRRVREVCGQPWLEGLFPDPTNREGRQR